LKLLRLRFRAGSRTDPRLEAYAPDFELAAGDPPEKVFELSTALHADGLANIASKN